MPDIVCKLKDYSMLHIDCDDGIGQEISDHFTFEVPGAKYMPIVKKKIWDGKVRLFNRITGELNAGLFVYLVKFCSERKLSLDTEETDYGLPVPEPEPPQFLDELLADEALPFQPKEYQLRAIKVALKRTRGILLSPTGSGKSFIMYLVMMYYLEYLAEHNESVLIIVPTTSLVEQLFSDFNAYGLDAEATVHKIYSGRDKSTTKRIILTTWQSVYKLPKPWFDNFGMILGDECHGFKSKSLSSIMNKATEAKYRYGLTGTLDGTLTHKLVLEGLFGPVYKVTTTKALQDDKTLAALDIKILLMNYQANVRKDFGKKTYQEEIEFLVSHEARNKFIRNLTLSLDGNTLVLFNLVEKHGKPLFDLINTKANGSRKVFFVSGSVATSDREDIRKIVESQKNSIIVASLGTFSTGINIKNLHNIVFASPSKSQIKVLQSIGRGLRVSDDGRMTTLYDIADDLTNGKNTNFTLRHSAERVKIYNKEQFNYKMIKVDLDG